MVTSRRRGGGGRGGEGEEGTVGGREGGREWRLKMVRLMPR